MNKKSDRSIGLRIKTIRKRLGLNQTGFGRLFGVTQAAISGWEQGVYPDGLSLLEIAKCGDTDVEWILTGVACRRSGTFPSKIFDEIGRDTSAQSERAYELCPLLHNHIASGPPKAIHDQDIAESLWIPSIIGSKESYLMQVRENAMEPIFKKEDIVAIREWPHDITALEGLIVAAWFPKEGLITRWLSAGQECWILHPETRGYPLFSVGEKEHIRFFRVIWWWGTRRE